MRRREASAAFLTRGVGYYFKEWPASEAENEDLTGGGGAVRHL